MCGDLCDLLTDVCLGVWPHMKDWVRFTSLRSLRSWSEIVYTPLKERKMLMMENGRDIIEIVRERNEFNLTRETNTNLASLGKKT